MQIPVITVHFNGVGKNLPPTIKNVLQIQDLKKIHNSS